MKKRIVLFLLTSAFGTSMLFAQGPPMTPPGAPMNPPGPPTGTPPSPPAPGQVAQRQVNRLTQLLGLSPAQQTAALSIFTTAITFDQSQQAAMQTERQNLRAALEGTPPCNAPACTPPTSISAAADIALGNIAKISTDIAKANALAETQLYSILTAAQQSTYNAARHQGPGPGRGMGGPPMGPGGPQGGFRGGPR